jgi:hypothetical protein
LSEGVLTFNVDSEDEINARASEMAGFTIRSTALLILDHGRASKYILFHHSESNPCYCSS